MTPRRAPRRATPYFRILLALLVLPIGLWLLPTNLLSPDTHPQTALAEPAAPPAAVRGSLAGGSARGEGRGGTTRRDRCAARNSRAGLCFEH